MNPIARMRMSISTVKSTDRSRSITVRNSAISSPNRLAGFCTQRINVFVTIAEMMRTSKPVDAATFWHSAPKPSVSTLR